VFFWGRIAYLVRADDVEDFEALGAKVETY
jgi:hypothetical protein